MTGGLHGKTKSCEYHVYTTSWYGGIWSWYNIRTDMGGYCQLNSHCPGITGLSDPIMNCVVYLTAALWSVSTQKVVGLNPTGHCSFFYELSCDSSAFL